jgi:hypothetical protein
MGKKFNHLMGLSKNGCQKFGLLADPEITDTLLTEI